MIRRPLATIRKKIDFFESKGIPYILHQTNERIEVHSKVGSYINKESFFPPHEINFIKRVKDYVIKNEIYMKFRRIFETEEERKKIKYFAYNKKIKPGTTITGGKEIDLKNAYWKTMRKYKIIDQQLYEEALPISWKKALQKGIIDRYTYERCKKITQPNAAKEKFITDDQRKQMAGKSKKTRLAAAGSMAKKTRTIEFDGKKQIVHDPDTSVLTEHLWDNICYQVGIRMVKAMKLSKDNFVFFWVDALFVSSDSYSKAIKYFKSQGYSYTISPVQWIRFDARHVVVKGKGKWVKVNAKKFAEYKEKGFKVNEGRQMVWKTERKFPFKNSLTDEQISKMVPE